MQCSFVNQSHPTVQQSIFLLPNWNSVPVDQSPCSPASGNHYSIPYFCEIAASLSTFTDMGAEMFRDLIYSKGKTSLVPNLHNANSAVLSNLTLPLS